MPIISWDDAIEHLRTLTRGAILHLIREKGDLHWMKESARPSACTIFNLGAWRHESERGAWPMLVILFERVETPILPKRTGAAIIMATPGRGRAFVQCCEAVTLTTFAGDPNGAPDAVNGDFPYLFGLADEDVVAAALGIGAAVRSEPTLA